MSAVSGAFLRTLFSHFFWQVRIKAQRVLSSCIDVFDNFARTLVPPTLSKLQNNPDVSHEEFKVCCPFIVGYNFHTFCDFLAIFSCSGLRSGATSSDCYRNVIWMNVLSYLNEVAPMPRNILLTASLFLPPFFLFMDLWMCFFIYFSFLRSSSREFWKLMSVSLSVLIWLFHGYIFGGVIV